MYIAKQNFPMVSEFMGNQFLVTFLSILQATKILLHTKKLFFMVQLNTFLTGFIGAILCMTLYIPVTYGQCPSPDYTHIQQTEAASFESSQGEIHFDFTEGETPNGSNYRIRLYDQVSERFVYDDNQPPFLNTVPSPAVEASKIKFTELPKGNYVLVLHGGACNQQMYEVAGNR